MKKAIAVIISIVAIMGIGAGLVGCTLQNRDSSISAEIYTQSVTMPETYSITYEVETIKGAVLTIQKTVDSEGNVYFRSGREEMLFLREDDNYVLYTGNGDGTFTAHTNAAVYSKTYVDSSTAEFRVYAEQSLQKYLPGMKQSGEKEVLGRTCTVYTVGIGYKDTGVSYELFVDSETGICLGWENSKELFGKDLRFDGEIFACTEFITEDVPSLREMISE